MLKHLLAQHLIHSCIHDKAKTFFEMFYQKTNSFALIFPIIAFEHRTPKGPAPP
jgi:hypothetical protein